MDVYKTKDYDEACVLVACGFRLRETQRTAGGRSVYFHFEGKELCEKTIEDHYAMELSLISYDLLAARKTVNGLLKK